MNKQPFYHRLEIIFTATLDLSDLEEESMLKEKIEQLLSKTFGAKIIGGSVEIDVFDSEPGSPDDLL